MRLSIPWHSIDQAKALAAAENKSWAEWRPNGTQSDALPLYTKQCLVLMVYWDLMVVGFEVQFCHL